MEGRSTDNFQGAKMHEKQHFQGLLLTLQKDFCDSNQTCENALWHSLTQFDFVKFDSKTYEFVCKILCFKISIFIDFLVVF